MLRVEDEKSSTAVKPSITKYNMILEQTQLEQMRTEYYQGKHDYGKSRMDLIPLRQVQKIGDVLAFGAIRYGERTWMSVENGIDRYLGACLRHITAYQSGELKDPDSGLEHLAHATTNILFIMELLDLEKESNGD